MRTFQKCMVWAPLLAALVVVTGCASRPCGECPPEEIRIFHDREAFLEAAGDLASVTFRAPEGEDRLVNCGEHGGMCIRRYWLRPPPFEGGPAFIYARLGGDLTISPRNNQTRIGFQVRPFYKMKANYRFAFSSGQVIRVPVNLDQPGRKFPSFVGFITRQPIGWIRFTMERSPNAPAAIIDEILVPTTGAGCVCSNDE